MAGITFSPLTAIAVGPAGPPSKLTVKPWSGPSTAIVITAQGVVKDADLQWIEVGLTVPLGTKIKGMVVCYKVIGSKATFISQVRLTEMTTPDVANVIHDDPTNLTSTTPVCYTSRVGGYIVKGTITLELRIAIGEANDKILIGGLTLLT
jgi:hypothetical protein